jgi:hypothetical protein
MGGSDVVLGELKTPTDYEHDVDARMAAFKAMPRPG